jgi:hypothetical protein
MHEPALATVRAQPPSAGRTGRRWPAADSLWWLALVAALFTAAQLAFVVPRLPLSWDETVYISQLSAHAPAAFFDPARARGVPLLVAPATALTGSVIVLRVYLAIASGIGLFLALLPWRGLRPAWMLALAAGAYGTVWVAIYYGPQAMPDEWVAFASLAAVGFMLRTAGTGDREAASGTLAWRWLAGLAGCVALAALFRPGDALFLAAGLFLAMLVKGWRRWQLPVAVAAGLAAGCAEWVVEAYLRFGRPLHRLHLAGAEQGGFGLHAGWWDEFKAANGPTLCRPCTVGLRYPEISLWWLVLPLLALLGILMARRAGRLRSALLPAFCALAVAFQYLFLINYAAPRFLLPAYALLTIPVADALGWMLTGVREDRLPLTQVTVCLAVMAQVLIQQVVLHHQVAEKAAYFGDYQRIAADLHKLGVRPPSCLVKGSQYIPIAWYTGCASAGPVPTSSSRAQSVVFLRYRREALPRYARGWQPHFLTGVRSASLRFTAYLPRGQAR